MTTRREFIKWTAASGAGLAVGRGLLNGRARAASAWAPAVGAGGVGGVEPDAVSRSDADTCR